MNANKVERILAGWEIDRHCTGNGVARRRECRAVYTRRKDSGGRTTHEGWQTFLQAEADCHGIVSYALVVVSPNRWTA